MSKRNTTMAAPRKHQRVRVVGVIPVAFVDDGETLRPLNVKQPVPDLAAWVAEMEKALNGEAP